ncbi:hypothetical protein [Burkholderia ubonensis]|uniref:hypothetical protein n=1 Tax=Burkholderia ubonensis TaxID=101571 RepID=UPI000A51A245|nr:hypothetical protein [Burkholderia ubonensis]
MNTPNQAAAGNTRLEGDESAIAALTARLQELSGSGLDRNIVAGPAFVLLGVAVRDPRIESVPLDRSKAIKSLQSLEPRGFLISKTTYKHWLANHFRSEDPPPVSSDPRYAYVQLGQSGIVEVACSGVADPSGPLVILTHALGDRGAEKLNVMFHQLGEEGPVVFLAALLRTDGRAVKNGTEICGTVRVSSVKGLPKTAASREEINAAFINELLDDLWARVVRTASNFEFDENA